MNVEQPMSKLQEQLIEMGFKIADIKAALQLTHDKHKIVENLIASKQISEMNNQIEAYNKLRQNKIEAQKNQDNDFQSCQDVYKMIFLMRMDLKLSLGKMAAQVATSALAAYKQIQSKIDTDQLAEIAFYEWTQSGTKKIVLKINSEEELLLLLDKLNSEKINVYANKAHKDDELNIPEGTIIVCAVGPAPQEVLNQLTGHLKLL